MGDGSVLDISATFLNRLFVVAPNSVTQQIDLRSIRKDNFSFFKRGYDNLFICSVYCGDVNNLKSGWGDIFLFGYSFKFFPFWTPAKIRGINKYYLIFTETLSQFLGEFLCDSAFSQTVNTINGNQ